MSENGKKDVLLEVDDSVRETARNLVQAARYGALATLSTNDGYPQCTRVGLATFKDGTPFIFISALAAHTGALLADPRCALLVGEPGKGDPLAHPRISLSCRAEVVAPHLNDAKQARKIYLEAHSKAQLYIDLPDFRFFRLVLVKASFNGGFGRAYALSTADLMMQI